MKRIISIILLLVSFFANGQTDTLSEVCITGVRARLDQPITQTTIYTKDLKKIYQGQDVPVILNFISPSITFTSDGGNWSGYMYYRLRGVDQTRINATLNGMPLNEPEDQGAYFSNYQDFFSNVSSIQIQRGVGTSSNGSSSYVGSLNFQSPNLSDSAYTSLEVGAGSFKTSRFSIVANTGSLNGWGTYVRCSQIKSDGYRDNSGTIGNTIFISTGYQNSKQSLKYTMFYGTSRNQMAWAPSPEDSIQKNRRYNPLIKDEIDFFVQNMNIISYSRFVNKKISYNISGFYNVLDGNYNVNFGTIVNPALYNYQLKSNFYGLSTNINYISDRIDMSVGVSQNNYDRRHSKGMDPNFEHNNIGRKYQSSAFYKLNYKLTTKLSVYTDLQYRFVKFNYYPITGENRNLSANWNFLNPKVGFNYIKSKSRIYAFYGVSNREPNRTDMFSSYSSNLDPDHLPYDTAVKYGWNNVKPEMVQDYEIGYDFTSRRHRLSVNLFYMYFKNGLLPIGAINDIGLPINTSVDASYRRGIEVDYKYNYKGLEFYLGTTLMNSKILTGGSEIKGSQMLLTPNLILNTNLSYVYNRISIMMLNKYVSRSYLSNDNESGYLDAYFVSNLNMSYTVKNVGIGFNINNLFNRDYNNSGQFSNGSRQYFVAARRNYFVGINIKF